MSKILAQPITERRPSLPQPRVHMTRQPNTHSIPAQMAKHSHKKYVTRSVTSNVVFHITPADGGEEIVFRNQTKLEVVNLNLVLAISLMDVLSRRKNLICAFRASQVPHEPLYLIRIVPRHIEKLISTPWIVFPVRENISMVQSIFLILDIVPVLTHLPTVLLGSYIVEKFRFVDIPNCVFQPMSRISAKSSPILAAFIQRLRRKVSNPFVSTKSALECV